MSTLQKSLRIPLETIKEIEEIAKSSGKDFTAAVRELLAEAIKAHRCPGIVFAEGTSGKRARIAGTGIEVWEIIAAYKSAGRSFRRLRKSFHWLTEQQLKSAIGYCALYTDEIEALVAENEKWTKDRISRTYPFLSAGKQ